MYYSSKKVFSLNVGDGAFLLINSLTGRKNLVNGDYFKIFLRPNDKKSCKMNGYDRAINFFIKRGYIFKKADGETRYLAQLCKDYNYYLFKKAPEISLVPNMSCNFKCIYCLESSKNKKFGRPLSAEQVDLIFDATVMLQRHICGRKPRSSHLDIFGGEPLLPPNRDSLKSIFEHCREHKMCCSMETNGYHLSEFVGLLSAYSDIIGSLQVTLDGTRSVHDRRRMTLGGGGTFEKISSGIDSALAKRIPINVRMNIDRKNTDLLSFVEYVRRKGWNKKRNFSIYPQPVNNHSGTCNDYPIFTRYTDFLKVIWKYTKMADPKKGIFNLPNSLFLRNLFKYTERQGSVPLQVIQCSVNRHFTFAPDGYIYPCALICGDVSYAIGRYHPKLVFFPERSPLWTKKMRTVATIRKCLKCPMATLCGTGCPLAGYKCHGSKWDAHCDIGPADMNDMLKFLEPYLVANYLRNKQPERKGAVKK